MKYKGSMLRRGILAGAMVLAGCGATVAVAAAPAGASNTEMTAVGSFTTFFMMHALFPELNDINPNKEVGSETQTIAARHPDLLGWHHVRHHRTDIQPPNGSGQGKTALAGEETLAANAQGCIDFSRSSSPPAPHSESLTNGDGETGDPSASNLDYYAYALDGVAPLVGSDAPSTVRSAGGDTGATKGLTLAQVQAIYECVDTNWDQITVDGVTGGNSPIALFWPQSGSGTRAVYTDVLGFDPTQAGTSPSVCTTSHRADRRVQRRRSPERREHRGRHHLPEQHRSARRQRRSWRRPSQPVMSRQRPSTSTRPVSSAASGTTPRTTTRGVPATQPRPPATSSTRTSTAPTRWGTSWPAPCPWPP